MGSYLFKEQFQKLWSYTCKEANLTVFILQIEHSNTSLTLTNTGNTNVLLRRIAQREQDGTDCIQLQPIRLYAGVRLELELSEKGFGRVISS